MLRWPDFGRTAQLRAAQQCQAMTGISQGHRRFAVAGLDEAARRGGRRRGLRVGAIDETSQVKQGCVTAGVKRQYLGCVGKVANGITTVHLSYVRERTGHALTGARQWVPAEQIDDPVKSLLMGLPLDLQFRTKGQLAIDILTEALADGVRLDFVCGDEVYGSCTELREFCDAHGQGYVLRVPSSFRLALAAGVMLSCAGAVTRLLHDARRWEVRSAGAGSKGQRWYGWAMLATASPRHHLLIRRHLASPAAPPHRYPSAPAGHARSAATAQPGHGPADRPAGHAPARRTAHPAATRPRGPLARLETPPPSPRPLVPPAHPARPQPRNCPGQLANGDCRTKYGGIYLGCDLRRRAGALASDLPTRNGGRSRSVRG
jgi:hypothetical protein